MVPMYAVFTIQARTTISHLVELRFGYKSKSSVIMSNVVQRIFNVNTIYHRGLHILITRPICQIGPYLKSMN